jgi:Tol biopolymer transport system component
VVNAESIGDPTNRTGLQEQLSVVDVDTGRAELLTSADAVQGRWSPHGQRIAFWRVHRGGQRDIWTMAASGSDLKPVTDDSALDWNPVWSPDGRYLYFASERGGSMNLWRVAIDERSGDIDGAFEAVTTPSAYSQHLSFSGDGRRLAYVEMARRVHLQRLMFDGEREQVVGPPAWILQDARPAKNADLSPDGTSIVFDSIEGLQEDLFLVRADGTGLRRLTDDAFKDRAPRWSPDGKQVLFFSDRNGRYDTWRMNPDGSGLQQISFTEGARGAQISVWSPDGTHIAVNLQAGAPVVIDSRVPWAKQSPVVAAPNGEQDFRFFAWSWSPDGRLLAGTSGGIATYGFDTHQFQKMTTYGERPHWLADSRRLVFMDGQKIYLLDTATKNTKEIYSAAPQRLQSIALSSDKRSIVVSLAIDEADIWLASLK